MTHFFNTIEKNFLFPDCSAMAIDSLEENRYTYKAEKTEHTSIQYHQLLSKDIYIGHHQLFLESPISFNLQTSHQVIQLHFVLKGEYELKFDEDRIVSIQSSQHNLLFLSDSSMSVTVDSGAPMEFLEIQLDLSFVERYISKSHILNHQIGSHRTPQLSEENMEITPQMQSVLYDLINCEFEGNLKSLYVRAKVIELLSLQLAQFEAGEKVNQSGLKSIDIEKMNKVRELITASPEQTYSLAFLARTAGTNEQYLKTYFKQIYGKTVFSYLTAYRMEKAKELLLTGDQKIADIAVEVGYSHATHFTKAFKKHFGYLPLKIKGIVRTLLFGIAQLSAEIELLSI